MSKTKLTPNHKRERAIEYLKSWLGTPYIYAGDDFQGLDCSGLMMEVLQSVGILKHRSDLTANGLRRKFALKKVNSPGAGCMVFWLKDILGEKIATHVAMLIDEYFFIEAGGGTKNTRTIADAIRDNAFVKMRPLYYRGENFIIIDPFKDD